jgi:hypothetical protein
VDRLVGELPSLRRLGGWDQFSVVLRAGRLSTVDKAQYYKTIMLRNSSSPAHGGCPWAMRGTGVPQSFTCCCSPSARTRPRQRSLSTCCGCRRLQLPAHPRLAEQPFAPNPLRLDGRPSTSARPQSGFLTVDYLGNGARRHPAGGANSRGARRHSKETPWPGGAHSRGPARGLVGPLQGSSTSTQRRPHRLRAGWPHATRRGGELVRLPLSAGSANWLLVT